MDPQLLIQAIAGGISPDPNIRNTAEEMLKQHFQNQGFLGLLLQMVMSQEVDMQVRQLGAIYFKNIINRHWVDRPSIRDQWLFPEEERPQVRDSILEAVVHAPEIVRKQLAIAMDRVISVQFPEKFPGIDAKLLQYLQSQDLNAIQGALTAFYVITKHYWLQDFGYRAPFDQLLVHFFPVIYNILQQLASNPTPEHLTVQRICLKIVYKAMGINLPPVMNKPEYADPWIKVCGDILDMPVVQSPDDTDVEDWPRRPVWKLKKWAGHILLKMFERYGLPDNVPDENKPFSQNFEAKWCNPIFQIVLKQLWQYRNGQYLSKRVLQRCLAYVEKAIGYSSTWLVLKPHLQEFITAIIFPLMCFDEEDDRLWKEDPYEFVRARHDIQDDYINPVSATANLLHEITTKRSKSTFDYIMTYIHGILTENQHAQTLDAFRKRDGALHMLATMANEVSKKKRYKQQLNQLLATFVIPEFKSPCGFLRLRACDVISKFSDCRLAPEVVQECTKQSLDCLVDPEMPVKIEAAICLGYLLGEQQDAITVIQPVLKKVVEVLMALLRETDNDDLTDVMVKMISVFDEEIMPFAVELSTGLVQAFMRLSEYDPNDEAEQHKVMAAAGVLDSLQALIEIFACEDDAKRIPLEHAVFPVIEFVLQKDFLDFIDEIINIMDAMTEFCVSELMWRAFELLYHCLKRGGIDWYQDSCSLQNNILKNGRAGVLAQPQRLQWIFDLAKTVWENIDGEAVKCQAAKMMELMVLHYADHPIIDQYVEAYVGMIITRLLHESQNPIKSPSARVTYLNVVIASLFARPVDVTAALEQVATPDGNSLVGKFMAVWFTNLPSFRGLHNRKLSIAALCKILQSPRQKFPATMLQSWPQILPALIELFSKLDAAYEVNEDTEDDIDPSDYADYDPDNEDPQDLADYENFNEEAIQREIARLRKTIRDDDDELDGIMADLKSPMDDNISEYPLFVTTFEGLQQHDPESFQVLTQSLNPEQQQLVQQLLGHAKAKIQEAQQNLMNKSS